jgi:hypothetical protein
MTAEFSALSFKLSFNLASDTLREPTSQILYSHATIRLLLKRYLYIPNVSYKLTRLADIYN